MNEKRKPKLLNHDMSEVRCDYSCDYNVLCWDLGCTRLVQQ